MKKKMHRLAVGAKWGAAKAARDSLASSEVNAIPPRPEAEEARNSRRVDASVFMGGEGLLFCDVRPPLRRGLLAGEELVEVEECAGDGDPGGGCRRGGVVESGVSCHLPGVVGVLGKPLEFIGVELFEDAEFFEGHWSRESSECGVLDSIGGWIGGTGKLVSQCLSTFEEDGIVERGQCLQWGVGSVALSQADIAAGAVEDHQAGVGVGPLEEDVHAASVSVGLVGDDPAGLVLVGQFFGAIGFDRMDGCSADASMEQSCGIEERVTNDFGFDPIATLSGQPEVVGVVCGESGCE